jgi:putative hydrolase of the HAD superfamily
MALPDDPEAIFVDVDNTLYAFEEDMTRTLREVHRVHQDDLGDLSPERFVDEYWGVVEAMDDDRIWRMVRDDPLGFREHLFQELDRRLDGRVTAGPDQLLATFEKHRYSEMQPFPGALETVEELTRRTTVGIVTNGPPAFQRPKIEGLGIDAIVPEELTFVSGEVGTHKPDPGIFEEAASAAGVEHPEAVMIGDGLEYDVPAKALGWGAIWFNAVGLDRPDEVPHEPDAVARCWEDVRGLLL